MSLRAFVFGPYSQIKTVAEGAFGKPMFQPPRAIPGAESDPRNKRDSNGSEFIGPRQIYGRNHGPKNCGDLPLPLANLMMPMCCTKS